MDRYSYDRRVTKKASFEDELEMIEEYAKKLNRYLKRAEWRPALIRQLGEVLETPEIVQTAHRGEKRIEDIKAFLKIIDATDNLVNTLNDDFEDLAKRLASKGGGLEGITEQTLWDLPTFSKVRDLADESRKITYRQRREEAIDWSVSNINEEAGIYKELNTKVPDDDEYQEALDVTQTLYGVLDSLDMNHLKEAVETYMEQGT